jgi:hypothetical protein
LTSSDKIVGTKSQRRPLPWELLPHPRKDFAGYVVAL